MQSSDITKVFVDSLLNFTQKTSPWWPSSPAADKIKIFNNVDKAAKHSEGKKPFAALLSLLKILISSTVGGLGRAI